MADGEMKIDHTPEAAQPQAQPGQVIAPGSSEPPKNEPVASSPTGQVDPTPAAEQAPEETTLQPRPAVTGQIEPPESSETPENTAEVQSESMADSGDEISWTASEFIAHEKSASWYLGIALAGALIAGLVFLITRDYISTAVVLVGAFGLGVLGGKKPKQQQYVLSPAGLTAGQKQYDYGAFKSFAIVPEGAFSSIVFMPLKRFAPLTTIYYPPEDERKITDLLAKHLPLEEHKLDAVDHLMQRIRF